MRYYSVAIDPDRVKSAALSKVSSKDVRSLAGWISGLGCTALVPVTLAVFFRRVQEQGRGVLQWVRGYGGGVFGSDFGLWL